MSKVIAGMTMSLDGFINDRHGSVEKLYADFEAMHQVASFQQMIANTGAAIMGRHVYEMADPFAWANDDYEFQADIFVLTHTPPVNYPPGNGKLKFTFVTDGIASAVAQAQAAAGDKDVQVIGGADTIQQCLNAGLCQELQIEIMPILLGAGTKLFANIDTDKIQLERTKLEAATPLRSSLTFRVSKAGY
jgi:dihydrofolate reductase